ncbi:hypothetical protein C0989_007500 [Termitomyces sp. Mn162]|nr:hypothetical protein C0989_007500 [Termitomyces sp. Mn162]
MGQGGRDTNSSKLDKMQGKESWSGHQASDQEWKLGNKALQISHVTGKPVRVIRGAPQKKPGLFKYAPPEGPGKMRVSLVLRHASFGLNDCRINFLSQVNLALSRMLQQTRLKDLLKLARGISQPKETYTSIKAKSISPELEAPPSPSPEPEGINCKRPRDVSSNLESSEELERWRDSTVYVESDEESPVYSECDDDQSWATLRGNQNLLSSGYKKRKI